MVNEQKTHDVEKGKSSHSLFSVLALVVFIVVFALFVYDYLKKSHELSYYKVHVAKLANIEQANKDNLKKLTTIYKETAIANARTAAGVAKSDIQPEGTSDKLEKEIANDIAKNLSPLLSKVNKGQDTIKNQQRVMNKQQVNTSKKLDRIMKELIAMLEKETARSKELQKRVRETLNRSRMREDRLQMELTETRKVVTGLNALTTELRAKYLAAHGDDSAFMDIARCAEAPAKFVINTFTFDWFEGSDLEKEERKYAIQHKMIMDYYNAIGNPEAMKRLKVQRQILHERMIQRMKQSKKYKSKK